MKKVLWTEQKKAEMRKLAAEGKNIAEIADILETTTSSVRNASRKFGIKLPRMKEAGRQKMPSRYELDKYEEKVLLAVQAGCTCISSVRSATGFNSYRIIEINKRLKLKIKTDKFKNQCANMLATSIGRGY